MIIAIVYVESNGCPAPELLKPCVCADNAIKCADYSDIDLVNIFQTLEKNLSKSEKHFKSFELHNTLNEVLEENIFQDITFDEIWIHGCGDLWDIERYTFNKTYLVTKKITLDNNNLKMGFPMFKILSSFVNIQFMYLNGIGVNEIPSNAFEPINGYQDNLKTLTFGDPFTRIGKYAFSNLRNLTHLSLFGYYLEKIEDHAFEFKEYSDRKFELELRSSLNFSIFNEKTFVNIRRPTELRLLSVDNAKYLEEKVFLPFLLDNVKNTINLVNVKVFDCNDFRNYWLKRNLIVDQRVTVNCSNNKILNDSDNFKMCKK